MLNSNLLHLPVKGEEDLMPKSSMIKSSSPSQLKSSQSPINKNIPETKRSAKVITRTIPIAHKKLIFFGIQYSDIITFSTFSIACSPFSANSTFIFHLSNSLLAIKTFIGLSSTSNTLWPDKSNASFS